MTGRPFVKGLSVKNGQANGEYLSPCQFQYIAHLAACGKTRVAQHNRRYKPKTRKLELRKYLRCSDVRIATGRRPSQGWTTDTAGSSRCGLVGVRVARLREAAA